MAAIRNEMRKKEKRDRSRRDRASSHVIAVTSWEYRVVRAMPAETEPKMGEVVPRYLFGDLHYRCEASLHQESAVSH